MSRSKSSRMLIAVAAVTAFLGCLPRSASSQDAPPTFDNVIPVRVGTGPYPMYQAFAMAKSKGYDALFGLDFQIQNFVNSAPNYQANVRGDLDVSFGCVAEQVAVMKGAPDIRHFFALGFYKGFFFVAREGKVKSWEDLKKEMPLEEAREARRNEFKGKTVMIIPQKIPLVVDMLEQAGLTRDDVTFMRFADDNKSATAFLAGEGDFYIGGIPQQSNLINQGGFVNAGGHEILGPAGVWYDSMSATDAFLLENREAALRTYACMLYFFEKFKQDPRTFSEIGAAELSRISGAEFSVEEFMEMQTVYDIFQDIDLCKTNVFNKDSEYYWKLPVDYTIEAAVKDGVLSSSMTVDEYSAKYFGESEKLFFEILERADLMALIESAVK